MAPFDQTKKRRPGRPLAVDDAMLVSARDQLVFLFETTWEHVGERLPWIKKPADVLETLQVWKTDNRHNHYYVAQLLLRPSTVAVEARDLASLRDQLRISNVRARDTWEVCEDCRKALETAQRALGDGLSDEDKVKVQDQIARRSEKLAKAEADYRSAHDRQKQIQESLNDAESSFARSEFVRFIKSNRYRLTPLSTANALAGLPYVGWRQSALRCKKHPAAGSNGLSIQVFNAIRRIANSCPRRSELIGHAECWLKDRKNRKSLGADELRKKFYYFRWAIKTVLEAEERVMTRGLPFAITREYWKRVNQPSPVDQLFEEEERIVV